MVANKINGGCYCRDAMTVDVKQCLCGELIAASKARRGDGEMFLPMVFQQRNDSRVVGSADG